MPIRYERYASTFLIVLMAGILAQTAPLKAAGNRSPLPVIAGENLIHNPGFENLAENYQWRKDNWWRGKNGERNKVTFTLDPRNPHGGEVSQRVTLSTFRQANVQLQYLLPSLKPKTAVQVRFWARGQHENSSLKVLFRRRGKPYTLYHTSAFILTKKWHEYAFYATMPEKAAAGKISIFFQFEKEDTIWLDDVKVIELPSKDSGKPLVGNQIKNGSFEVGRDRWYATFRETGSYANAPTAQENNIKANLASRIIPDAPQGKRALQFTLGEKCRTLLTSAFFPLRYGYPTTISFWLKAPAAGRVIQFSACQGGYSNIIRYRKTFRSTDAKWQRYAFTFTPGPSSSRTYFIEFQISGEGTYLLDAVSAVEGKSVPAKYSPTTNVGWEPVGRSHPANLFNKGDKIRFNLLGVALPGTAALNLQGQIVDAWERVVQAKINIRLPLDAAGNGRARLSLPADRYGAFKCKLYLRGKTKGLPAVEIVYHVLPQLTPLKEVQTSYFGGHFQLTPYNLRIAEKGGFRWLRLHPPLNTKWEVVEPQKNVFVFSTAGVKRAATRGFKVLGSLDTTPKFYTDTYFKNKKHLGFGSGFPPNDWQAWERYVAKTVKAFYPYIQHWEIWNEPNVRHFLRVKPGDEKAKVYFDICQHTRAAITRTGLNVSLIGGAMAQALILTRHREFNDRILALGINKEIDAFSFHHYGDLPSVSQQQQLASWQKFTNRKNVPLPIWNSEGGPPPGRTSSWLHTARIPNLYDSPVVEVAGEIIRTLVAFKALGVKQNFLYHGFAQPAGRIVYRNACSNLVDVNGIPLPSLSAHATAVRFLEGTLPLGLREVKVAGKRVIVTSFQKGDLRVEVVWVKQGKVMVTQRLSKEPLPKGQIFDLMGNPYSGTPGTTNSPVYILWKKKN